MFFVGVFGIDQKKEHLKTISPFDCRNPKCSGKADIFLVYSRFHFFFVPIFKWNKKLYVECGGCSALYKVKDEKVQGILTGEAELTYWDLDEIYGQRSASQCPSCGYPVEPDFQFCPKCGQRMR